MPFLRPITVVSLPFNHVKTTLTAGKHFPPAGSPVQHMVQQSSKIMSCAVWSYGHIFEQAKVFGNIKTIYLHSLLPLILNIRLDFLVGVQFEANFITSCS